MGDREALSKVMGDARAVVARKSSARIRSLRGGASAKELPAWRAEHPYPGSEDDAALDAALAWMQKRIADERADEREQCKTAVLAALDSDDIDWWDSPAGDIDRVVREVFDGDVTPARCGDVLDEPRAHRRVCVLPSEHTVALHTDGEATWGLAGG